MAKAIPQARLRPVASATPTAVSYADPTALYRAVDAAGAPRVEDLRVSTFTKAWGMPADAEAAKGVFLVSSPEGTLVLSDGSPAGNVVSAVFPDAASKRLGTLFGQHMAKALGWPSIWQLQGPNWVVWSTVRDSLQSVQSAVGGSLTRTTPLVTIQPSPPA